jgi:hypothetical protein
MNAETVISKIQVVVNTTEAVLMNAATVINKIPAVVNTT